jgi:tRNA wybutosine-synthesizing protein 2
MFSRGNLSEKARILGLSPGGARSEPSTAPRFPGLTALELGEPGSAVDVVDFYIGIGYFAFCYLARGVRRVWGWDINPWSIEALRRGCERNGWASLVVRLDDQGNLMGGGVTSLVEKIVAGDLDRQGAQVRCIAFLGDNKWADKVMAEIECEIESTACRLRLNVRHANLGLLPTSRGSWEQAVKVILGVDRRGKGGWLHVHENVDVRHTEDMSRDIVRDVDRFVQVALQGKDMACSVSCDHIEPVKTYAPGVMHCVFDIKIQIQITSNG